MPATASGSPIAPFVKALADVLEGDATYMALSSSGLFSKLPEQQRVDPPYTVLGQRTFDDQGGAMQLEGGRVTLQLDTWSAANTPAEVQAMQSRARYLLQRTNLVVEGFTLVSGSLTCELEQVFDEFDADMPQRSLFHGAQLWTALIDEISR